jgi:hypothetical protein
MVFVPFDVDDSEMQYIANVKREDGVDMPAQSLRARIAAQS